MQQTITVDIINDKALNLLIDLEKLDLIRLHLESDEKPDAKTAQRNYKGTMTQQSKNEIESQLKELRGSWE